MPDWDERDETRWVSGVVHIGTDTRTRGGIATVISAIKDNTPEQSRLDHIITHCDGSVGKRMMVFARSLPRLLRSLVGGSDRIYHLHVSAHGSFVRKSICILLIRPFSKPIVAHMHGSDFASFYDQIGSVGRWLFRLVLRRATVVVALSPEWNRFFRKMVPAERVVTLANAVAVPPLARHRPAAGDRLSILSLGQLGERKGTYDLIEAFALIAARHGAATLDLAGDGEIAQVEELIEKRGLTGRVRVHGWVDRAGCERLLGGCDVFVLPSYAEGLPMALLEAMSHGIPVVSTPVGGIPTLIEDGMNGLLVKPGDVNAIADAITSLGNRPADMIRMGEAGRETILTKYSIGSYVRALNDVYRGVLERDDTAAPRSLSSQALQGVPGRQNHLPPA